MVKQTWQRIVLIVSVALVIWLPRGFGLDRFVATDEVPWLWRSANFYYALSQRDFSATYFNNSPGIVLMWVETAAMLVEFPEYRGFGQGQFDKYMLYEKFLNSKGIDPHDILITSRKLMVFLYTILLTAAFVYAWRLLGLIPALVGFLWIAFDPFFSGLTRLAHLDGPVACFMFLSLLAFLAYLYDGRRFFDLFLSAIMGGLAMLAKIQGILVIPVIGSIALICYIGERIENKRRLTLREQLSSLASRFIGPLIPWGIAFLITLIVFFPGMWENPVEQLKKLVLSPVTTSKLVKEEQLSNNDDLVEETEERVTALIQEQPLDYFMRYPRLYIWHTSPVVWLGLFAALISYVRKYGNFNNKKIRQNVVGIIIFVFIYTIVISIPPKSSSKYYSPVYPVLDLVAGVGWISITGWLGKILSITQKRFSRYIPAFILIAVILFQIASSWQAYPYDLIYFNPFILHSKNASEILSAGSGEGLDLAAKYLNQKPHAEKLRVLSWYGIGSFSYFFVGETLPLQKGYLFWNAKAISDLREADYLVVFSNQWRRGLPTGLFPILDRVDPEHSIWINGIECARIYEVSKLPPEIFIPYKE